MDQVQFDEQKTDFVRNFSPIKRKTLMVRLMEKLGVPEKYVDRVFIGIILICVITTLFIIFFSENSKLKPLTPQEQQKMKDAGFV